EAGDCLIKVLFYARARNAYLHGLCDRRFAQFLSLELDGWITGIHERTNHHRFWNEFVQKLESLWYQFRSNKVDAGDIAARPVKAFDEPCFPRLTAAHEDNRKLVGRPLCRESWSIAATCDNHRHPTTHQIGRERRQSINVTLCPAVLYRCVAALDKARCFKAFPEARQESVITVRRRDAEEADYRFSRLLRGRGERACRHCASDKCDEVSS